MLGAIMFLIFQAVYAWAAPLMDLIDAGATWLAAWVTATLPTGPLASLLADGVIAGLGGVVIFLPQILILFAFILALEESGYLPRAAFPARSDDVGGRLVRALLHSVAVEFRLRDSRHHGHTFDPGPARSHRDDSGRAADDLLGASAGVRPADRRLHPAARRSAGYFKLQGLVLFALYMAGVFSALLVAWVMKKWRRDKASTR
jgi:ferrous iron transport protein B